MDNLKYKYKLSLVTQSDVLNFVSAISKAEGKAILTGTDEDTIVQINAKSVIGALYSMTWKEVWIESENDVYFLISDFVI